MKNHFLKLFFFRRFFFSPKRKSGKIPVVLLSLALLTACQPTPETEVVMNKGDGTLETVIHSEPAASAEAAQTVRDALGVPEKASLTVRVVFPS